MTTTEEGLRHLRKLASGKGAKPQPLKQGYVSFLRSESRAGENRLVD
ncbi:hypothetical protein [Sphingomonas sp. Sph1(2015)]|jgi:hypothetical protein|nr:hypothetical protein [Sphingomonas sp. Sph1(2015)]